MVFGFVCCCIAGDYRVSDNYLKELSPHFEESIQVLGLTLLDFVLFLLSANTSFFKKKNFF